MVVPDRIVQTQRLVPRPPLIARTLPPVDDQRGHPELAETSAEGDPTLPAADDEDVGVGGLAPGVVLLGELLRPALPFGIDAVFGAFDPASAAGLLMSGDLLQRGEHGPGLDAVFVDEADESLATPHRGGEGEPCFGHSVGSCRRLAEFELLRRDAVEVMGEQVGDPIGILHRLEIPSEGHKVSPIAVRGEQSGGGRNIPAAQGRFKVLQPPHCDVIGSQLGTVERRCHLSSSLSSVTPN